MCHLCLFAIMLLNLTWQLSFPYDALFIFVALALAVLSPNTLLYLAIFLMCPCVFSLQPLSYEEKEEMAMETVGLGTWDDLTPAERDQLIKDEVWRPNVREQVNN